MNLQGDVVGLLNSSGTLVARYAYNAWGEIISVTNAAGTAITSSTHIATLNPLRYRGYYYDTETGFYYLQSRYYDPVTHRFINADSYQSTGQGFTGTNMFAYCNNSPVACADSNGCETVVVIYDGRSSGNFFGLIGGVGFQKQGNKIISNLKGEGYDVISYSYATMDEFVTSWNAMTGLDEEIYRVYIVGHGAPGSLDCAGKRLKAEDGDYSFDDLNEVIVQDAVYLLCCNGGTPDERNSITANHISRRAYTRVYASNAGVNISWWNGKYSSKGKWSWFTATGKSDISGRNTMELY